MRYVLTPSCANGALTFNSTNSIIFMDPYRYPKFDPLYVPRSVAASRLHLPYTLCKLSMPPDSPRISRFYLSVCVNGRGCALLLCLSRSPSSTGSTPTLHFRCLCCVVNLLFIYCMYRGTRPNIPRCLVRVTGRPNKFCQCLTVTTQMRIHHV